MIRFHTQTWLTLAAASIVMAGGLFLFMRGQTEQVAAHKLASSVKLARSQVEALDASSKDYVELIRRIRWRPGIELRRETVDMSVTFAGNELDRINELFSASYSGTGYFSLSAFKIEDVTPKNGNNDAPFALRVNIRGDNILVLEPR